MPEMKTLNGYEVVDAKARREIEALKNTETDLSAYAKKSELPTKTSQLTNDNKFITLADVPKTDLSEYVTESELAQKGYLTQHQSLAGLATEKYVDDAIANIELPKGLATEDYVDDAITRATLSADGLQKLQSLEAAIAAIEARLDELGGN